MKYIKKYLKFIIIFIVLILILGFYYSSNQKYFGVENESSIPVPITNWIPYSSTSGFSFMYPTNLKVKTNNNEIEIGEINIKIEKLNCTTKMSKKIIMSQTTLYGFKAGIDETKKTAYICNNTKTACLDITTNKTRITEGFFHSFISSLNLNSDFDKIECEK